MKTSAIPFWRFALISAVSIVTLGCSSPEESRDKAFARGNAAFEKKQHAEAILEYRNALKSDPLYAPARQKLGEAYEKTGDLRNAGREFVRAADLLPKDAPAQLRASRYLLAGGQFEDAGTRARRALEIDSQNVDAHILLGSAIAGTKDLDGAIKQIQEAINIDPSSGSGHINMGALLQAQGRKAAAQESFEKAIKLDPKSITARLALATYHLNSGSLKDAEEAVKAALAVNPADGQANRAMALLLIGTGRTPDAEPYVKAAVGATGTPESELSLADYYLRINKIDAAKPILEGLTGNANLFAPASIRLAALDYVAGRKDEAHKRVDGIIERQPGSVEAMIVKGQWLLTEERKADALAMAQNAVKINPRSAPAQFILGRARSVTGDRAGAEEAFNEVIRLNPRAGAAQTELARLNLAAGKTDVGVQFARDAIKNQPRNADPRVLLVRGLIARRDLDRASTELAPLTRALPNDPLIHALNGALLVLKKDMVGARREYDRALEGDPGQIDALVGLTGLDVEAGQLDRARQRLAVQLQRTPTNPTLLLLTARADFQARDLAAGEQHLRQVIAIDPSIMPAYDLLARLYLQQRRMDEALKEFQLIAERQPGNVGAITLIGIIHNGQNRLDEAEKAYKRALDAGAAAPVAANNLAYLYADRNHNLEEALALARAAAAHLKDNPAVLDTVGWVYYKKGEADLAVAQFEASVQKEPQNPIYQYHLGLAYVKAGEQVKARRALAEALRLNPSFTGADDARRALASLPS
ncbi:MAG: tetratricopeptide repeat protein [Vicinamibacterales bacterium]